MRKEWYKVTFYAKMSQDDVHAMNKYLYDTMNEAMEIEECEGLSIEQDEPSGYQEPEYDLALCEGEFELDMRSGDILLNKEEFLPLLDEKGIAEDGSEVRIKFDDEDIDDPYRIYRINSVDDEYITLNFVE